LQGHGTIVRLHQTEDEIGGDLFYRHPGAIDHYGVNTAQLIVMREDVEIADVIGCKMHESNRKPSSGRRKAVMAAGRFFRYRLPK